MVHTRLLIALTRFTLWLAFLCGRFAWHIGYHCRKLGKYLMLVGEEEIRYSWGAILFSRLWRTQIEIVSAFPKVYHGEIIGASFCFNERDNKRNVVLHLNWIATNAALFGPCPRDPWIFGGPCTIVIDPALSPIRELDGGDLWFSWPGGNYGVIHFNSSKHLRFAGSADTPRIYKYF